MNWSGISNKSVVGKLLRFPLRLIPKEMVVRIMAGQLKHYKWIAGSSNHGCWLGSYEYEKQMMFVQNIKKGDVVFDLGANVGYYTLLASKLVGLDGRVYAFEPLPKNVQYLKKHMVLNKIQNVEIIEAAVTNVTKNLKFKIGLTKAMGCIDVSGDIDVNAVTLDEMIEAKKLNPPKVMKIDIEGGEVNALVGAKKMIKKHHPLIFVATHGECVHIETCKMLKEYGYKLSPIDGISIENSTELVAV